MRKLIVHMQTTLDGRISRPDGFFWEPFPWGDEETSYVNQFFAAADTWVMSRKLYEFVVPYWEQVAAGTAPDIGVPDSPARTEFAHILAGLTKVVFSHTLSDDPTTSRVVRSGDLVAHLRELKARRRRCRHALPVAGTSLTTPDRQILNCLPTNCLIDSGGHP